MLPFHVCHFQGMAELILYKQDRPVLTLHLLEAQSAPNYTYKNDHVNK